MTHLCGGRLVETQAPEQSGGCRPTRQGIHNDEEREEAQEQNGRKEHAPIHKIHRVQSTPQMFSE